MPRHSIARILAAATVALLGLIAVCVPAGGAGREYRPEIVPSEFSHHVTHPYFPLTPGTTLNYSETNGRETALGTVTVTHDTKVVMGVKCLVVHETATVDGVLKEDIREWYAQHRDGSVWCFGEAAREFKPGGRVFTEGSWEAGVGGAQPGVVMPGDLRVGHRYRQELMRNVAEDIAEISALRETVTVPAGTFTDCVRTRDWSMLESGSSKKWFARGVGFVRAEAVGGEECVLLSITRK
jgi:hypothetical protein